MFSSFWCKQTKFHSRVAINFGVRGSGGSGEKLSTNKAFAQAVNTHHEHFADLVGAVSATAILGAHRL
jgi:hypothetical protein